MGLAEMLLTLLLLKQLFFILHRARVFEYQVMGGSQAVVRHV